MTLVEMQATKKQRADPHRSMDPRGRWHEVTAAPEAGGAARESRAGGSSSPSLGEAELEVLVGVGAGRHGDA
eukprot:CAMPEP_0197427628 /NCGR_PEP_ID=MMETSP1170-20131217/38906_1 /TAXON_ID=54406 /ORGANISM="Sarcinochrysis sp, Strain CCMP770" /LENGTH=71 /DNA_ID=CAMNT_0042955329 /DNA_START=25 /DNA_END=236 /DNA_ORIENTATION=-